MLLLFDNSAKASERLRLLSEYQPEHCQTMHEFAGFKPDLVLLDEAMTPGIAKELIDWGIAVCVLVERVTVNLRRRFPMVKDMMTDAKVLDYLADYFASGEEEKGEESTVEPSLSAVVNEFAATAVPTLEKTETSNISSNRSNTTTTPIPPVVVSPRQESRASNRGAKVIGCISLRSHGGSAGKTGVVFNYAAYMAARGKKVIVVDLDPSGPLGELAGATQDLNIEHWCNLMRQHQGDFMTERAVFDNVERQSRYGFYMIPSSTANESTIEKDQFRWILSQLIPYFDVVAFDMPADYTMTTYEMMRNANELFLFGPYDRFQYKAFKRTVENIVHPLNVGIASEHLYVFLGRGYLGKNKEIELAEVKRQLGLNNVVLIPEDPLFHQYRDENKAIVLEHPKAECAKALIPWLDTQVSETVTANVPALYEPAQHTSFKFLTRLFGKKKHGKVVHQ